jgi:hypothetical protein
MPKPKRKKIDIKNILATNPGVNAKEFAEALKVLDELRNSGVQITRYNLVLPFSKGLPRLRRSGSDSEKDPRLVRSS